MKVFIYLLALFFSNLVFAKTISPYSNTQNLIITKGTIIGVPDGDTLCIKTENNELKKVRMQGTDAPENDQLDGEWSGQQLRQISLNQEVTVYSGREDQYGRLLGYAEITPLIHDECTEQQNDKLQLNEYMLCKGGSWYYVRYENSFTPENKQLWTDANKKAKELKVGIWKSDDSLLIPPWEWRQTHKPEPIPCAEPTH